MLQQFLRPASIFTSHQIALFEKANGTVGDILEIADGRGDDVEGSRQTLSIASRKECLLESTYYYWNPPEAAVTVKLAYEVVDQILPDVLRGFSAIPKRGAEVGGILFGRFEDEKTVAIDSFVAVPCDYKLGPGYEFTDADRVRFKDTVTPAAVGYYRSHTGEGFGPTEEDRQRLATLFRDPRSPLLLIQPFATKVSRGAFFFRIDGKLEPSVQNDFPFSRKLLGGGSRRPKVGESPAAPEAEPARPLVEIPLPKVEPVSPAANPENPSEPAAGYSKGFLAAALTLAVALGWAGGFFTARNVPRIPQPEFYQLRLQAAPRGSDVDVKWNPQADAIRTATRATLSVKNEAGEKTVRLDLDQLRQGRAVILDAAVSTIHLNLEVEQIAGSTIRESIELKRP